MLMISRAPVCPEQCGKWVEIGVACRNISMSASMSASKSACMPRTDETSIAWAHCELHCEDKQYEGENSSDAPTS